MHEPGDAPSGTLSASESIPARFEATAAAHPARIAVCSSAGNWSYDELDKRSRAVARQVAEHAGNGNAPIALLMEHDGPLIGAILGVLRSGHIYAVLNASDPLASLQRVLRFSGAPLLLSDAAHWPLAQSLSTDACRAVRISFDDVSQPGSPLPEVQASAGAWLMFTSGSTGAPKGIWQNHRGVVHHSDTYRELIRLDSNDRVSMLTPGHLAASATALFSALLSGAAVCPFDVRTRGVDRLARWLSDQEITVYHSVPSVFRHMARTAQGTESLGSLRWIRLGGEAVLRADARLFQQHCAPECRLLHALSSTETGLISALILDRNSELPHHRLPAGHAVTGVDLRVLNDAGELARKGEGRIAVRSAHLSQGYWDQPDATAAAFQQDPLDPGRRTFITEDLGRIGAGGMLEHLGRVDRQVKIRGRRVDLGEVEAALRDSNDVSDAAVMAVEDQSGEATLTACVVPADPARLAPEDLRRRFHGVIPDHLLPSRFVVLQTLPRTAGGKLDRKALALAASAGPRRAARRDPPIKGVELRLALIWQSVLGQSNLSRHDDFFDLGGTSIHAAQVVSRIQERFDVALSPSTLIQHSTLEALARAVTDTTLCNVSGTLVTLNRNQDAPGRPLFLVHSGEGDVAVYGQLARRMTSRTIYGLQSTGLDGEAAPRLGIREMARHYVEEVIAKDPTGPYLLGGVRMGALVAFEMAQQLVRDGKAVGLVAMIDFAPPRKLSAASTLIKPVTAIRDQARLLAWSLIRRFGKGRKQKWLQRYRAFIAKMNCHARHDYAPTPFNGPITLFVTPDRLTGNWESRLARFSRQAKVISLSGERARMFGPPTVDELAARLEEQIKAATADG